VQSLTVNGKVVQSGAPYEVPFNGSPQTVPIVVTAHDGKTTDTYKVALSR